MSPYADPLGPYEAALAAYFAGDAAATVHLESDVGEDEDLPMRVFFRGPDEFFPFERRALDLCRGRVLDLGAGAGVHALDLQERGLEVTAVEVLAGAGEIMRARGVRHVITADFFHLVAPPADTVLLLMNGIGPVGTLDRIPVFLQRIATLLRPGGQVLVDSGSPNVQPGYVRELGSWPPRTGTYPGEAWVRLAFRGEAGPPFRELYVDFSTFAARVRDAGWRCEQVWGEAEDHFVARLTPPPPKAA
jgi:SAM-dependent methyltransferase